MTVPIYAPICMSCVHYERGGDPDSYHCSAFPDGIPDGIIHNKRNHIFPVKGDRGLHWEQDPKRPKMDVDAYLELLPKPKKEDLGG